MPVRDGYSLVLAAVAFAVAAYAAALRMRSWPMWLFAFLLTIVALAITWYVRSPARLA